MHGVAEAREHGATHRKMVSPTMPEKLVETAKKAPATTCVAAPPSSTARRPTRSASKPKEKPVSWMNAPITVVSELTSA